MEVILKENVKKLGSAGDLVKVTDGYARNFLFPQNLAMPVSEKNLKAIQEEMKRRSVKLEAKKDKLKQTAGQLEGKEFTIKKKASADDKLFGSVTEADVADAVKAAGYDVNKSNIKMESHIKEVGNFAVKVKLKGDIEANIVVWVVKEAGNK